MGQFMTEAVLHGALKYRPGGSKSFNEEDVDVVNVPLHKGRAPIKRRPECSLVLALPAAEVGCGELVTMAHPNLGHTGCITCALLNLAADVVVAVSPGKKSLQLFHGHVEPPEGCFTANPT